MRARPSKGETNPRPKTKEEVTIISSVQKKKLRVQETKQNKATATKRNRIEAKPSTALKMSAQTTSKPKSNE